VADRGGWRFTSVPTTTNPGDRDARIEQGLVEV